MEGQRWVRWSSLIGGTVLIVFGSVLIGIYLFGVFEVITEDPPDKSWLFWGLGLFLFGMFGLGTGIGLAVLGRSLRSSSRNR
ncbi:MAG: hypothetical protein WBM90_04160 [Acidimicrobiia bacterium]